MVVLAAAVDRGAAEARGLGQAPDHLRDPDCALLLQLEEVPDALRQHDALELRGLRLGVVLRRDARRLERVAVDVLPDRLGSKRVIQRRFNVSVPRARVPRKAPTLRDRSER